MLRLLGSLMLLVGCAFGCGQCGRGERAIGEACDADGECRSGLCVAGVVPGGESACTKSCMPGGHDCPEGWFCSAATSAGVVVCSRSPATPFGP